jgi:hypothetical protein
VSRGPDVAPAPTVKALLYFQSVAEGADARLEEEEGGRNNYFKCSNKAVARVR